MAAGDAGSPKRYYSATAVETTITAAIPSASQGDSYTSFVVASTSGFAASFPYTLLIDPDTNKEEVVTVTAGTGTTLTVTRGQDSTQAVAHSAGATVRHAVSARDFRELQTHIAARGYDADSAIMTNIETHVHGLGSGDGSVVGTTKAQTLSGKTMSTTNNTFTGIATLAGAETLTNKLLTSPTVDGDGIYFEGSTADGNETRLTVVDPTADRIITLPNVTGTVAILDASQTLENKTLTSNTLGSDLAAGGFKVSGLATPAATSDAATKGYVDTQVANLVDSAPGTLDTLNELAAALGDDPNFATTITNSIASKLSLSGGTMTGAIAMGTNKITGLGDPTSAQDAATKNYIDTQTTSAGASATAAAASAAAASASATSAATSATSAANSYSAVIGLTGSGILRDMGSITETDTTSSTYLNIATVAASAANSASAAATSATSAAASANAAATSATSATTSATSAANSANAAATSATSAANSASAAANSAAAAASAIQATIFDVKGDLIVASAADTAARLPVGSNGQILTAASTATYGVEWAAAPISLPSQTGNNGYYLTTDGSTASWAAITTDPLPSVFLLMGA